MKATTEKVQQILNNSNWECEYCHPDKWSGADQDKCISKIESSHFGVDLVGEYLDQWMDEILAEYKFRENCDFYQLCAEYIADPISTEKLKSCYYPKSATFRIVNLS